MHASRGGTGHRDGAVSRNHRLNAALAPERWYVRASRLAVAVWAGAAVVHDLVDAATGASENDVATVLSFFTIQANMLLVAVLLVGALAARRRLPAWWDELRGAAAFYLVMTGLVYALLVAPPDELWRWDIGWTGLILHRVAPVFALADWALVTMTRRTGWGRPLAWLAYPLAYLGYTWARGAAVNWYPYPFLDPRPPGSWSTVMAGTAQVLVAFLAVAVVLHLVGVARVALARGRAGRAGR